MIVYVNFNSKAKLYYHFIEKHNYLAKKQKYFARASVYLTLDLWWNKWLYISAILASYILFLGKTVLMLSLSN